MKTSYRIRVYATGVLLGCVLVYFTLIKDKNRGYWLPENRVKEKVQKSRVIFSEQARCIITCEAISEEKVKDILQKGEINFSESDTRRTPCPSYVFEGEHMKIICTSCDSVSEITTIISPKKKQDTCQCL